MITDLLASAVAFAVAFCAIVLLRPFAHRLGLVDKPGGRKHHDGEVPITGGLAMVVGLMAGVCLQPELRVNTAMLCLVGASILMLIVGVVDDTRTLSPRLRIAATLLISMLVVRMERFQLTSLGDLLGLGSIHTGLVAIPLTLFCIVGVVNALNMVDGVDGLAGSLTLVALSAMAWMSASAGDSLSWALISIVIAVVTAFLCFNARTPMRGSASVFMGDGGSMFLGFAVGALLIGLSQSTPTYARVLSPVIALWLLALPLMDAVCILVRRMRSGRSPFSADRGHLHHVLQDAGYTPGQSVFIIFVLASILALVGVMGQHFAVPEPVMFGGFMLLFFVYYLGMQYARVPGEE